MSTSSVGFDEQPPRPSGDPFADPSSARNSAVHETSTLALGRDASLTLGTDSLIILDEDLPQAHQNHNLLDSCCGLFRLRSTIHTRSIPFYNVLWAELSDEGTELTIRYANAISKKAVRPASIQYPVPKESSRRAAIWAECLMERAYGRSQRRKRIKVLINPFGGQGKAHKYYARDIEPIFSAARCSLDVETTKRSGHAAEIAERMDVDAFDVVANCSGDGLPYEVLNGLGKRSDAGRALAKIAISQLPCGSGNAMSWNLNGTAYPSLAALALVKGLRTPLDLLSITQGDNRFLSFLSQSVGLVAEVDLGTDHLRWMGDLRFTWGFLERLLRKTVYPCEIALLAVVEDKQEIRRLHREAINAKPVVPTSQVDDPRTNKATAQEVALPPLRFGTINDPLPPGWEMRSYPTMSSIYAGNMPWMAADSNFFQAALPNDGYLDMLMMDGEASRWKAIQSMLALSNGTFFDSPAIIYRKIEGYRLIPKPRAGKEGGYISIDGERVPFEPYQVEVHRSLGTVISKSGNIYEAPPL